jgi:PHD/YefM family antitoxin component YafN of YafNO toxin-antitoxin module
MQASNACDDCIVTYICDREPEQAVVIDLADFRAMKLLADAGLVPDLKHTGH